MIAKDGERNGPLSTTRSDDDDDDDPLVVYRPWRNTRTNLAETTRQKINITRSVYRLYVA